MTYAETLEFLYDSLPMFQREGAAAYKPGLENTAAFAQLLGNPQQRFRTIHIAGTNGKGSTSHMLAAILQSAGLRTGLFTSPHLKDFRERVRVDGQMISQAQVIDFVEHYREQMVERGLTFFEMCTLLAFDHFAREGVQVAIIETGLGGRLDATNIITPMLSVITNIDLDHISLLGNTLEEIATEKSGIIKSGVPVVIGCHEKVLDSIFTTKSALLGSPIYFADDMYRIEEIQTLNKKTDSAATIPGGQLLRVIPHKTPSYELLIDLMGEYQRFNVRTVLAVCKLLSIPDDAIRTGCANTQNLTGLRGRWQILSMQPLIICDTGHNAHGIKEVAAQLARQQFERLFIVFGVVEDKDLDAILPLLPQSAHYIFTQPSTPRARDFRSLAQIAANYGLHGDTAPTVPEALGLAHSMATPNDMIFIGGSTFTVADIPNTMMDIPEIT